MVIFLSFLAFLLRVECKKSNHEVINVELNQVDEYSLSKGKSLSFCYEPLTFMSMFQSPLNSLFNDLQIEIISINSQPFSWYSIRGVSTDAHINKLALNMLSDPNNNDDSTMPFISSAVRNKKAALQTEKEPYEKTSFLRDLLSSCPSPFTGYFYLLHSNNAHVCNMRFSTFGKSCVTVTHPGAAGPSFSKTESENEEWKFLVDVKEHYHHGYVVYLATGLTLGYYIQHLAKSKLFQYLIGSTLGAFCGLPFSFFFLIARLCQVDEMTPFAMEIIYPLLLLASLGTSFLIFFHFNLFSLYLLHWEVSTIYLIISTILGMVVIRSARCDEEGTKHSLVVTVKWVLRIIAALLIYQGFASPLYSMLAWIGLVVIYVGYAIRKMIMKMFAQWKQKLTTAAGGEKTNK